MDDKVIRSRSDAAWLTRSSTETIRRWEQGGELAVISSKRGVFEVGWEQLRACATEHGFDPLDPEWLSVNSADPLPSVWRTRGDQAEPGSLADPVDIVMELQDRLDQAEEALRKTQATVDSVDQAAMAYRDAWRQRALPSSPRGLAGT